jgi:hypothetical protein
MDSHSLGEEESTFQRVETSTILQPSGRLHFWETDSATKLTSARWGATAMRPPTFLKCQDTTLTRSWSKDKVFLILKGQGRLFVRFEIPSFFYKQGQSY